MPPENPVTALMVFNGVLGLAAFFGGVTLRGILERLKTLEEARQTNERIRALEVADDEMGSQLGMLRQELPTNYIRRDDFKDAMEGQRRDAQAGLAQVLNKLDRIEDQMLRKADKP